MYQSMVLRIVIQSGTQNQMKIMKMLQITQSSSLVNILRRKCQTKCGINPQTNLYNSEDHFESINSPLQSSTDTPNTEETPNDLPQKKFHKKSNNKIIKKRFSNSLNELDNRTPIESSEQMNLIANMRPFNFSIEKKNELFNFESPRDPKFKSLLRVIKYKKAMGLPDEMSYEESSELIDEYFQRTHKGLHYFEKTGTPVYGLNFNSLSWLRCLQKTFTYKHVAAELFENKVIYDFSYDSFMILKEKKSLLHQLLICLGLNNKHRFPFPIMFANLEPDSYVCKRLKDMYFSTSNNVNAVTVTDKSYLDILPREKIIYLSPHAEESLVEFLPQYHYVIGCFVDISFSKKLSYKKAQAEGVKCYKLPIDEFVHYSKEHHKLLPLPIVHQILLDKKMKVDWKFTLECNLGWNRLDFEIDELDKFKKKYKDSKLHFY